jgi:uncharacterized protein (TIGR03067 family)
MGFPVSAAEPTQEATAKELANLAGVWKVVSAEREGDADAGFKGVQITFLKDGTFKVKAVKTREETGTYKLDPETNIKSIDYILNYGPNKGKLLKGIYAFEGDALKLCRSEPGKDRPTEFKTKEGSSRLLLVMRREKP